MTSRDRCARTSLPVFIHSLHERVAVSQVDKFALECGDLGDLTKVVVGHDGEGFGAGWFLKKIIVRPVLTPDDDRDDVDDDDVSKRKYLFVCERWLDAGEDDKKIERELLLVEKEEKKPKESELLECSYAVTS